ncbi:MAG TPA: ROK family protein [Aggregatilineaceae bacterium]|nr:ROK family protein [Aggregatilineaceae bacterium]
MTNPKEWAIGIDIGATNSQAALVHRQDGATVGLDRQPTRAEQGPEIGLKRIGDMVEAALIRSGLDRPALAGIGVGCTGPLDIERGLIMEPWTMPGWREVPVVDYLSRRFRLPVYLDNDCNVAALGEHWIGAGQGHSNVLYVAVSTGIGAGIIIDGQLRRGFECNMGEVGLMSIDLDGGTCGGGSSGCWEFLASGPAIAEAARSQADDQMLAAAGGDLTQVTAELVARLAAEGHTAARSVMEREAFYLGVGLANLIVILAPEIVVLGGGVMRSWGSLQPTIERVVRERTRLIPSAQQIPIVRTRLDLSAGYIGAARMVFLASTQTPV